MKNAAYLATVATVALITATSASAQSTPTPEAERFFRGVLQWAGVQFPVTVSGSPLEVRYTDRAWPGPSPFVDPPVVRARFERYAEGL